MTAETVLMNRSALAFAADSAVTLTAGGHAKIHNDAEKIFQLSNTQPIGIMFYNNAEFNGVPIDVIVREYRNFAPKPDRGFARLSGAAVHFLYYLRDKYNNNTHEINYFISYFSTVISSIIDDAQRKLIQLLVMRRNGSKNRTEFNAQKSETIFRDTLMQSIKQNIAEYQDVMLKQYLQNLTIEEFKIVYEEKSKNTIDEMISYSIFPNLRQDESIKALFFELAYYVLRSSKKSDLFTGLVFGGFGYEDQFPRLASVEIDGSQFGKLKIFRQSYTAIDTIHQRAAFRSFAQTDMTERFLFGIDESAMNAVRDYVQEALKEVFKLRPRAFSKSEINHLTAKLSNEFSQLMRDLRDAEEGATLEILAHMSRRQLADMASALVELTSTKRRFSPDQETVGGPIDVAVISRNEGFVWVRRKHYFDRNLNPGYEARLLAAARLGAK
ncbi:MAG: hypothetical protein JNM13_04575 [Hyphomicrobiaceae bacterium]|nr:hypothetical protein [Hyphomicrobiaceae bacterium]